MKPKIIYTSRRKGESFDDWKNKEHNAHIDMWIKEKKAEGKWLPKEEYEKKTGRPGRK